MRESGGEEGGKKWEGEGREGVVKKEKKEVGRRRGSWVYSSSPAVCR